MTNDVLKIFKSNPDTFLSIKEIASLMNTSIQSTGKLIKGIEKRNTIESKQVLGQNNIKVKLYRLKNTDDTFEEALHQYNIMRNDSRFQYMGAEGIRQLMIISELKKLNERMDKNGN